MTTEKIISKKVVSKFINNYKHKSPRKNALSSKPFVQLYPRTKFDIKKSNYNSITNNKDQTRKQKPPYSLKRIKVLHLQHFHNTFTINYM